MVLALALGHATVATTLSLVHLAERAGQALVQALGLHVLQVEFGGTPQGQRLDFSPGQLGELMQAVPLATEVVAFGVSETMLEQGPRTRRTQLITGGIGEAGVLLGMAAPVRAGHTPWCLLDADQPRSAGAGGRALASVRTGAGTARQLRRAATSPAGAQTGASRRVDT